jgi:hypothetical protein
MLGFHRCLHAGFGSQRPVLHGLRAQPSHFFDEQCFDFVRRTHRPLALLGQLQDGSHAFFEFRVRI